MSLLQKIDSSQGCETEKQFYEPSLAELAFGFDEQFAGRVKKIWVDSNEVKTTFQNDLNTLNNRSSFSLYLQGAEQDPMVYQARS